MWSLRGHFADNQVVELGGELIDTGHTHIRALAGVLANLTGGRHGVSLGTGTAAAQAESFVADLERVFPGVAAARTGMREARMHWPTFPWTRGSYASYKPGQWTGICGAEGEPVDRLFFAGEHCSLSAQGFMEGGCETGEQAARSILQSVGVQVGTRGGSTRSLSQSAVARVAARTAARRPALVG